MPLGVPDRPLIFVAHPDDETLAFGGLLQRSPASLVVFATDGASPGYGCERKYGSLQAYSDLRFQEAARALANTPNPKFQRLSKPDGSYFVELNLFEELPAAAICLREIVRSFSPDAIISHAYEGAHIDHDACSFLALQIAAELSVMRFEFPLYWLDARNRVVRQQFRGTYPGATAGTSQAAVKEVLEWRLTEAEIQCKKKMLAEYHTQSGTVSTFEPSIERMRPAATTKRSFSVALCRSYMHQSRQPRFYHTRRHRVSAKALLKKFAEFEVWRPQSADWR